MPQTEAKQGPDLSIRLADPQTPLYGGSIILGHVERTSDMAAPLAAVHVRLLGRAKAKARLNDGDSGFVYYRSRFGFWPDAAVADVVHEGPIHIGPGPGGGGEHQAWPFALALPTHTDAASVTDCGGDRERRACFLHPGRRVGSAAGIPEQALPGSFHFEHQGASRLWHGFVEYWIEAELVVVRGRGPNVKATLPVRVFPAPAPAPSVGDSRLAEKNIAGCVRTQRLLPGMERAELSFAQKTQKLFGSSRVPSFHYTLNVQYPTVIQMGSESSIPFLLHVSPERDKTTDVIRDIPQTVRVGSVQLDIHTTFATIYPFRDEPLELKKTHRMCIARIGRPSPTEESIVLPSGWGEEPLDLGAVLNLQVDAAGCVRHMTRKWRGCLGKTLVPTFLTYCVKVEHELRWDVCLSVAGETWRCGHTQKVRVAPPSDPMAPSSSSAALAPPYDGTEWSPPAYGNGAGGPAGTQSAAGGAS